MSEVIDPPEYYFPNINFNPAFYANEATGFTEAQANALYLRKTVPDTATAIETFNAGINSNALSTFNGNVNIVGTGSDLIVANSQTVPTKYISLSTTNVTPDITLTDTSNSIVISPAGIEPSIGAPVPTLNIASLQNVNLNVGTGTRNGLGTFVEPYIIHNYSDGDNCTAGNGVHLNNGTNNNSNTNIHNGQTSGGNVNIMTGTSSTGTVNVGIAGTTTNVKGIVNINGVGSSNTQLITIGNSTATGITTLASPITNITKIVSNVLDATSPTNTITIGANQTDGIINIGTNALRTVTGRINLGNSDSPTDVNGNLTVGENLYSTNILDTQVDGTQNIYTTKTSGNLDCLATSSTATLNVRGTGGIKTNNLAGLTTNGALTIGTDQTTGGTIGIGSSLSTTTLAGTVNLPSSYARLNVIQTFNAVQSFTGTIWGLACSRIKGITGQTTLSLFDEQTASDITIGLASTITLDGTVKTNTIEPTTIGTAITIGNTTTAGINLATGALSATGFVSIASSASNNSASYMNLGSDSLGYTYFRSRNIDINGNGAGNTSIGSTAGSGTITLYKPITVGYVPSAITSTSMIGYTTIDTITITGVLASGTFNDLFTPITLPAGVWMVNYSVRFLSASTSTLGDIFVYGQDSITGTTPPLSIAGNSVTQIITTSGISFTGSFPVVSSGTTTYTIGGIVNYSGGGVSIQLGTNYGSSVRRTRIA